MQTNPDTIILKKAPDMIYAKKYHIKTWGCQMNVYDSQRIGEILQSLKYESTEDVSEADLVILNTCHVREKATEKVYSDIGRLKILKERRRKIGKNLIIGISGCVAQAEGEEIIKRAPIVDMVFGTQTWHKLKDMIYEIENNHKKVFNTDFPVEEKFDSLPHIFDIKRVQSGAAFIAIQEGCDKFCTYCVVPYTRGAEYSRPTWKVLNEIDQLANQGAQEIMLLGQNVNAYHGDAHDGTQWTLGKLIRKVAEHPKITRIRYTTSYPAEVDDDLISAHQEVSKLMPLLHLPVQSGSNKILKAMNRRHTVEQYLDLIKRLKQANPNLAFTSDFIVGFPGETEEDFCATLALIDQVEFIQAYSFIFSSRLGTPAALMANQIDETVKLERLHRLQGVLEGHTKKFNLDCVGKIFSVLLDRPGKQPNQLVGKNSYMQAVHVDNVGLEKIGTIVNLKITAAYQNSLAGELV
ncbi:tRNA-2-methylthio-N(6)-dimethylallyladenosine synthase [Candidatus Hepatincolaceae symbiont of Richtersius coronifer]